MLGEGGKLKRNLILVILHLLSGMHSSLSLCLLDSL
ncbi:hypothetical protein PUN4_280308 [Paraburkholderia unamae]|nr:hypothetical protein PUN4_280308 [Paraburkholderia unamae]